jgi:hypothetical protein
MRRTLLASAALLGLACGPVLAQNTTSSTMSPPAPNAGVGTPEPTNSLPAGAGTATRMAPGNNVGTTGTGVSRPAPMRAMPTTEPMSTAPADTGMTGMRPMRGQMHHGRMAHGAGEAGATEATTSPGREYRGGAGSPRSTRASNSTAANTRSEIAPRLPDPAADANTPQSYLAAAQRALNSGRTGAAQEALERAETRLLSRSTEQSMADSPDASPMVQRIGAARRALAARDTAAAKSAISAAMSSGG